MSGEKNGNGKSVPMAWVIGALWAVTMALAGAWATSVKADLSSVTEILREREGRISKLEAHQEDGDRRLGRIESKVDRLLERAD